MRRRIEREKRSSRPGVAGRAPVIVPLQTTDARTLQSEHELVSVIVPAFNAARTLDETLRSVRAQSWKALEIVVVDDGSTDETAMIAHRHVEGDPRVRVIQQDNAGVAAARNLAIANTSGRYIAPIDADDLWSPLKIERQMQAVAAHGAEPGLVYTWFCLIDAESCVIMSEDRGVAEGHVLAELCRRNLVGTGSNALILRAAFDAVGGYDTSLRARGAQGAEDYDLYLRIAEHYEFAVVRDYLTGYRDVIGNMSSDVQQMILSRDLCMAAIAARHPDLHHEIRAGRMRFLRFMVARLHRQNRISAAMRLFARMVVASPVGAMASVAELIRERMHRRRQEQINPVRSQRFKIGDPETSLISHNRATIGGGAEPDTT